MLFTVMLMALVPAQPLRIGVLPTLADRDEQRYFTYLARTTLQAEGAVAVILDCTEELECKARITAERLDAVLLAEVSTGGPWNKGSVGVVSTASGEELSKIEIVSAEGKGFARNFEAAVAASHENVAVRLGRAITGTRDLGKLPHAITATAVGLTAAGGGLLFASAYMSLALQEDLVKAPSSAEAQAARLRTAGHLQLAGGVAIGVGLVAVCVSVMLFKVHRAAPVQVAFEPISRTLFLTAVW